MEMRTPTATRAANVGLVPAILFAALHFIPLPAIGAAFEGDVEVRWLVDANGPDREVELLNTFAFVDQRGVRWEVPKGAVVDGASIPRAVWREVGSPFVGNYRRASVVHDYYCDEASRARGSQVRRWQDVHRMFYEASKAGGVPGLGARLMYAAILLGGPRWDYQPGGAPHMDRYVVSTRGLTEIEMQGLEAWIEEDRSLEEIEEHVNNLREADLK